MTIHYSRKKLEKLSIFCGLMNSYQDIYSYFYWKYRKLGHQVFDIIFDGYPFFEGEEYCGEDPVKKWKKLQKMYRKIKSIKTKDMIKYLSINDPRKLEVSLFEKDDKILEPYKILERKFRRV